MIPQKLKLYIKAPEHRIKTERPERLLNLLRTFSLYPVPEGNLQMNNENIGFVLLLLTLFLFKTRNTHKSF